MPFELIEPTKVLVTNVNPRREFHGEEKVRALDIAWKLPGENTLLDLIESGLRSHHYFDKAAKAGQRALLSNQPLPNLRYPNLPLTYTYAKGQKSRGYRFVWDYGIEDALADFTDAVLSNLHYELQEGGSCTIFGSVSYNGEELEDDALFGRLSGLAAEGEIFIKLLAPPELIAVKKGYRAGKPDTPAHTANDGQGELEDGSAGSDGSGAGDGTPGPDTPEGAFLAAGTPAVTH